MNKGKETGVMVYQTQKTFIIILATILLSITACSEITPIWKGECKVSNFTLYTNEPCEYKVDIGSEFATEQGKLELTITYYSKIARNDLPLNISLEQDNTHEIQEFSESIPLKKEGNLLGTPIEGKEYDLVLIYDLTEAIKLDAGNYTLRIFASDLEVASGEIEGVMQIDARMYAISTEEDE